MSAAPVQAEDRAELVLFVASSGLYQASRVGLNLVAAALLTPALFGAWSLVIVILTYSTHATLGLLSGANRRIPLLLGSGSAGDARRTEQVAIGGALGIGSLLALGAFAASFVVEPGWRGAAVALGLALAGQQLYLAGQVILRGNLAFDRASVQQLVLAFVLPAVGVPALAAGGLGGLILAQATAYWVGVGLVARWRADLRPAFDRAPAASLLREGTPIMLSGLVFAVATSVDRWAIAAVGTSEELGQYGLASLNASAMLFANVILAQRLYPRMASEFGAGGLSVLAIAGLARRQGVLAGALAVPAAVAVVALAPLLVPLFLPAYAPSVFAMQVLAGAYALLALTSGYMNLLVTIGHASRLLILQLSAAAATASLALAALKSGLGISGVALSTLAGIALIAVGSWVLAGRARAAERRAHRVS